MIKLHNGKLYQFLMTCAACPEQYDVILNKKQVGYIRLRHGALFAECFDCMQDVVFFGNPKGDGIFEEDEREYWLNQCLIAIDNYVEKNIDRLSQLPEYKY